MKNQSLVSSLKTIFSLPVFPSDDEKTRVSRVLYYTVAVLFIASIGIYLANFNETSPLMPITTGMRLLACILSLIFLQYGRDKVASALLIGLTWISIAISIPLNGGVYAVGYSMGYFLLIVIASLLIGFRAGLIVAIASVFYGAWLTFVQVPGLLPSFEMYRDPQRMWVVQTLIFLIISVFIHYSTLTIREALVKAKEELSGRLKSEHSLKEAEQNYTEIFNATNEAIFIQDAVTGKILDVNQTALLMYGYNSKDEMLLLTVADLSANDITFSQAKADEFIQVSLSGTPQIFDWLAQKKNGELFWVEVSLRSSEIRGEKRILAVVRDNSTRGTEQLINENEQRLRVLSESTFEGIAFTEKGIIIDLNTRMATMLGDKQSELIGKPVENFIAPESRDQVHNMIISGSEEPYEHWIVRSNGTKILVEARGHRTMLRGKEVRVTVIRDMTERKRMEESLRRIITDARCLLWHAYVIRNGDTYNWELQVSNEDAAMQFLPMKITAGETYSDAWRNSKFDDEEEQLEKNFVRALEQLKPGYSQEFRCVIADGSVRWLNEDVRITQIVEDKWEFVGVCTDITERKSAEKVLRENEERFSALSNASFEGILVHEKGVIVDANQAMAKLFGFEHANDLIGKNGFDLLPMTPQSRELIIQAAQTGFTDPYEISILRKDGSTFPAETQGRNMIYNGRNLRVVAMRDITRRKKAEEVLKESEERFRIMFENAANSIALVDMQGRPFKSNPALQKMLGYTDIELAKMSFTEFTHPDDKNRDLKLFEELLGDKRKYYKIQKRFIRKDGSIVWANLNVSMVRNSNGDPLFAIGIIEDITEQKHSEEQKRKLEEQLLHAQKMDSIGRLAGGIAHDFNNMLTPILGFGELLAKSFKDDDPRKNRLKQMMHAAESSKGLVSKLLTFARKQKLEMKSVNLNAVTTEFTKILHRALRENITVKTRLDPTLINILGELGQIEQIILNLALNAQDAMPDGGTLFIETSNVQMKHNLIINDEEMQSGDYAMLAVSDTGMGIDSSILPQIFEPFFTTKETGKGTGLGLSTVYGIVKQHNGHVSVYSELHKGTTFKVYFPHYHTADEPQIITDIHHGRSTAQNKKVFVVEDQEQILELVSEVLAEEGYIVSAASTVVEAVKKFQPLSGTIDLFISDVILPDGNGRQLYNDLAVLQPGLKVLFMSSYTENIISHHKLLSEGVGFISKPFSLSDFISKVAVMID